MMLRVSILLSLSLLSACATYGSRPPAPASTSSPAVVRGDSQPAQTSQPAPATVINTPQPVRIEPAPFPRPGIPSEPAPLPPLDRAPDPGTPSSTLLASVDQAISAGDLERAAALAERALRISPRDPYLWYRRATISYQQRQYGDAEGFARRALSFAGSDRALAQQINQLLSQL